MADERDAPADEAAWLIGAVQQWARQNFPAPPPGGGADCQWCPLCQFMAVLRGERPELTERVAEAGAAVAGIVRALLETGGQERRPSPRPRPHRIDPDG